MKRPTRATWASKNKAIIPHQLRVLRDFLTREALTNPAALALLLELGGKLGGGVRA